MLYSFQPEIDIDVKGDVPEGKVISAEERIEVLYKHKKTLKSTLEQAHRAQKKYYDLKHKLIQFTRGDKIVLNTRNISQLHPSKKLSDKYLGPFEVLQAVGNHRQAYKLDLPPTYHIHDIFYVSLLEP